MGLRYHILLILPLYGCWGSQDLFRVAAGNIHHESVSEPTVVEDGVIPEWLDGNFVRHSCGAFGEVDSVGSGLQGQGFYNHIDHLFDCFGSGTNFKIQDGEAKFTNRFWPSAIREVYKEFNENMNDSRVFMKGVLGFFDYERYVELSPNVTGHKSELVPGDFPQVTFWQIGHNIMSMSEGVSSGQVIDIHTLDNLGSFPYTGDNPGEGGAAFGNPAHEQMDTNGDLWSMTGMYRVTGDGTGVTEYVIYKVDADGNRTVVTQHQIGNYNTSKCVGTNPYPDLDDRFGYLHAFGLTEHYVVIPMTSWLADPCFLFLDNRPELAYFRGGFNWYEEHESSLLVIRKSDGQHVNTIRTDSFFVTHMLNTYEDGDDIIMDLLVYDDSLVYTEATRLESIYQSQIPESTLERMVLDTNDWTVSRSSLRAGGKAKMEFTQYNQAYNTLPYQYGYFVQNPYQVDGSIVKINVESGAELQYEFPSGVFPFEPIFVARPEAVTEDDGVLLIQAVDANEQKTWLVILDAITMTLEAQVVAPDISLIGIHNRYFPCIVGGSGPGDTSYCSHRQTGTASYNIAGYMLIVFSTVFLCVFI